MGKAFRRAGTTGKSGCRGERAEVLLQKNLSSGCVRESRLPGATGKGPARIQRSETLQSGARREKALRGLPPRQALPEKCHGSGRDPVMGLTAYSDVRYKRE